MNLPNRLSDLYTHMRQSLWVAGVQTAERDARVIILNHTGLEWSDIIAQGQERVEIDILKNIEADIERRVGGEPISRIYGERSFWGLDFKICEDTLDPRPDTETIVEVALEKFQEKPPEMILDLGTGSGCILIALLSEWPDTIGIGIDKSLNAVKTAQKNAQSNNVRDRAHFYCGSWGLALEQQFELIVSNPPYIPNQVIPTLSKEVQNHDPILALDGGEDGLEAYRSIITETPRLLKSGGTSLFEIGYNQQADVMRLVEESGLSVEGVHHDLAGLPRVVEISCGDK